MTHLMLSYLRTRFSKTKKKHIRLIFISYVKSLYHLISISIPTIYYTIREFALTVSDSIYIE